MGSVIVVDQLQTLADLETDWARMANDLPFCHPGWMMPWWDVYGQIPSRKLFFICVLDDQGSPIGMAPWYRERNALGGQVIKFLGSGEVCSDYLTVLSNPGDEKVVAEHLAKWLTLSSEVNWDQLRFESVPKVGHTSLDQLIENLGDQGMGICKTQKDSCWRIELPNDMDEYLKRLSRNQRYQIGRLSRKQFETGNVTVEIATSPQQLEMQWPKLVDLHQKRREFLGEPGCFANVKFKKFLHDATLKLGETGNATIIVLKEDGQPVAAEHQLLGSSTVFAYQSGLDPDRLEISPGKLANYATIQSAIAGNKKYFDFCRGNEPYKAMWRADPVHCDEIRVISNRISAGVKHQIWSASQHMKTWVKQTMAS